LNKKIKRVLKKHRKKLKKLKSKARALRLKAGEKVKEQTVVTAKENVEGTVPEGLV